MQGLVGCVSCKVEPRLEYQPCGYQKKRFGCRNGPMNSRLTREMEKSMKDRLRVSQRCRLNSWIAGGRCADEGRLMMDDVRCRDMMSGTVLRKLNFR